MTSLTVEYKFGRGENIDSVVNKLGDKCLSIKDSNGSELYNRNPVTRPTTRSRTKPVKNTPFVNVDTQKKSSKNDKSDLEMFFEKYEPRVEKYSNKSLLITTKRNVSKNDLIFTSSYLDKPLYYNNTLKGWVSSINNSETLYKFVKLGDNNSFDDNLSELSEDQVLYNLEYSYYKNGLLIKPKSNDPRKGTKYFNGGFWNDTLKGWIFNKSKEDELVHMGATLS